MPCLMGNARMLLITNKVLQSDSVKKRVKFLFASSWLYLDSQRVKTSLKA